MPDIMLSICFLVSLSLKNITPEIAPIATQPPEIAGKRNVPSITLNEYELIAMYIARITPIPAEDSTSFLSNIKLFFSPFAERNVYKANASMEAIMYKALTYSRL